jgi:hypothetical protein
MKKTPSNQFAGEATPGGPAGTRKQMGDQASSRRHPPHVAQYERGKPVQHDTEAPDAVPVLPANASGHDKHTAEHHGAPIDRGSMYEGRPSEDRRTSPSEESHS